MLDLLTRLGSLWQNRVDRPGPDDDPPLSELFSPAMYDELRAGLRAHPAAGDLSALDAAWTGDYSRRRAVSGFLRDRCIPPPPTGPISQPPAWLRRPARRSGWNARERRAQRQRSPTMSRCSRVRAEAAVSRAGKVAAGGEARRGNPECRGGARQRMRVTACRVRADERAAVRGCRTAQGSGGRRRAPTGTSAAPDEHEAPPRPPPSPGPALSRPHFVRAVHRAGLLGRCRVVRAPGHRFRRAAVVTPFSKPATSAAAGFESCT